MIASLYSSQRRLMNVPALPAAWPIAGHLPQMIWKLPQLLGGASEVAGAIFQVKFGPMGWVVVCTHPDSMILMKNKVSTSSLYSEVLPSLGCAMVRMDGIDHRNIRSWAQVPFHPTGLSIAQIGEITAGTTLDHVCRWLNQRKFALTESTRQLAMATVLHLIGIEEADIPAWTKAYARFLVLSAIPFDIPCTPFDRGRGARRWIDERLAYFIQESRRGRYKKCMLSSLVAAFDASDVQHDEAYLIDNVRFLLAAGSDSNSGAMAQLIIWLIRESVLWDALCEEAESIGSVPRSPDDLAKFPFSTALFRETVRCSPPAPLTFRRLHEDVELGGYAIPAGTTCVISLYSLSRHPEIFESPDLFFPARWLNRHEPIRQQELLQFGSGPHFCLGYHLAHLEFVQLAVAMALVMGRKSRLIFSREKKVNFHYFPTTHPNSSLEVTVV